MRKQVIFVPLVLLALSSAGAGAMLGARSAKKARPVEAVADDGEQCAGLERAQWEVRSLRARVELLEARLAAAGGGEESPAVAEGAPAAPAAEIPLPAEAPPPAEAPAETPQPAPTIVGSELAAETWMENAQTRILEVWQRVRPEGAGEGQVACTHDQCRLELAAGGDVPVEQRVQKVLSEISTFLPYSLVETEGETTAIVFRRRPG
jgi:hypothetical protein